MDSMSRELDDWLAGMGIEPGTRAARVEETRQRIGRLARVFGHVLAEVADSHGMSMGDWEALSVLARRDGPCTPTELGAALRLTSGTVSTRLNRLLRAGLVETVTSDDGRSRPIALTRTGRRRWSAATRDRVAREKDMFASLDMAELAVLNRNLSEILGRFEDRYGSAPRHDRVE